MQLQRLRAESMQKQFCNLEHICIIWKKTEQKNNNNKKRKNKLKTKLKKRNFFCQTEKVVRKIVVNRSKSLQGVFLVHFKFWGLYLFF